MTTYYELDLLLQRKDTSSTKKIPQRKVANHTYAVRRGDDIAIKLHDTDILTFSSDSDTCAITLNSDGWTTSVTMDRMNRFLPRASVVSVNGRWHLRTGSAQLPYQDSIELWGDEIRNHLFPADQRKQDLHNAQVRKFTEQMIKQIRKVGWLDRGPDCRLCALHQGASLYENTLLWEELERPDHLITHLVEGIAFTGDTHWRAFVWRYGHDCNWADLRSNIPAFREFLYHHLLQGALMKRGSVRAQETQVFQPF